MAEQPTAPHKHPAGHYWLLGGLGTAAAVVAAPFVLPVVGLGNFALTAQTMSICDMSVAAGSNGLVGAATAGLSHVPLLGQFLATGSFVNILASGGIGIGGMLLGNYLERRFDKPGAVPWGKIIKYTALATSLFIALPSLLGGISMGITFLSLLIAGPGIASMVAGAVGSTLGFLGGANGVAVGAGIVSLLPHLMTCGLALAPLVAGVYVPKVIRTPKPTEQAAPVRLELTAATAITKDQTAQLAFRLVDGKTGRALGPDAIRTTHTEKLHTMIVDRSLTDYHHLHPTYQKDSGLFTCSFTPRLSNGYSAWHDFTLNGASAPTHLKTELPCPLRAQQQPRITPTTSATSDGLAMQLTIDPPLQAGQSSTVTASIRDASGQLVPDLEPIMGAYAHLAGFSQNGADFIHCHPMGDAPTSEQSRGNGQLMFHITPTTAEPCKFFLQVKRGGHETVLPFGQFVQPARTHLERQQTAAPAHAGHAMA